MNPSTKPPASSASWIPPSAFPAGATVSFTGSGDAYQVQGDGSLRRAGAGPRGTKRERRDARRRRAFELARLRDRLFKVTSTKEGQGAPAVERAAGPDVEGRTDALPEDARAAHGEHAPLAMGTLARGQPET